MEYKINKTMKLREFRSEDAKRLAELCNNKKIWDNLRDYIPHPYTGKDAEEFISSCRNENPQLTFAIEIDGEFAGSIGLVKQKDVYRLSAEIGYWLGEPYWGKGIMTEAVRQVTGYGFGRLELVRIYTCVFDFNRASQRVLEKAGYSLECISEKALVKNGRICGEYRYSILNSKTDE
jgi:RimJ/RimL family protein N-acetyltransferase